MDTKLKADIEDIRSGIKTRRFTNEAPRVNEASHAMRRKDARGRTLAFDRDKAVLPFACDL
jgi:hypothetical protein